MITVPDDVLDTVVTGPEEGVLREVEIRDEIRRIFDTFPADERAVVWRACLEDVPLLDLCAESGIGVDRARQLLAEAEEKLRRMTMPPGQEQLPLSP